MPIATAQMNSKQFETRNFVFSPEIWIQKYAMKPQSQETVLSPHESRGELFGCRGDPRLRLARVLEARGAFAEAEPLLRRVLEATERLRGPEHRDTLAAVNNLAWVLQLLGKLSEAPLRAASSHGRVAFCGGKSWGKSAGKQSSQNCDNANHLKSF